MSFTHKTVQLLLRSGKFPGRDFLIEKLPKWFVKSTTDKVVVKTRFGFSIEVDPSFDANIENVIYQRGVYEYGTLAFVQNTLKAGDTFVDAGANIGFLSLAAAAKVGAKGNVYAFEPVPDTFDILAKNKELNQFDQMHLFSKALGNEATNIKIYPETQNRGGASIVNKRSVEGIDIEVVRFDDLDIGSKVDMMKVDVEGFEWEVLKGAEQMIRKDRPILIVEYSQDRDNKGSSNDMVRWINDLDTYNIYRLARGKERPSKLLPVISKTVGLPQHDNIICLPKNN